MQKVKIIPNIDTICVLLDIENYEENAKDIIEYLLKEKEKTKEEQLTSPDYSNILDIGNMKFEILPIGKRGYSILLKNDSYEIDIAQYRSKLKNFLPIQIRISSSELWSTGISKSWAIIYNWVVEIFGNIISEKVCRLDLCSHIDGVDFITNYEIVYKGDFKKRQTFYTNSKINCITFGSRKGKNIYCRIYNKSLEVQETHKKYWFYEIWRKNDMDIDNVWNLEFEIKSEFLRQFNIFSVKDVLNYINDIWKYCTCKWLVKINRTNIRVERCDIDIEWEEIQEAYDKFEAKGLIKRDRQNDLESINLIPNITGCFTSYSARKGEKNIEKAFKYLFKDIQIYLKNNDTSFSNVVNKKMSIFNINEVNKIE